MTNATLDYGKLSWQERKKLDVAEHEADGPKVWDAQHGTFYFATGATMGRDPGCAVTPPETEREKRRNVLRYFAVRLAHAESQFANMRAELIRNTRGGLLASDSDLEFLRASAAEVQRLRVCLKTAEDELNPPHLLEEKLRREAEVQAKIASRLLDIDSITIDT